MKKKIKDLGRQVNKAVKNKEWVKADELIEQVLQMTNQQDKENKDLTKLRQDIAGEVEQAEAPADASRNARTRPRVSCSWARTRNPSGSPTWASRTARPTGIGSAW